MSDKEFNAIIDKAAFVVDGYAFSVEDGQVHVLALQAPGHALVLSHEGEVLETMHVHASDKQLTETGSAKFFVKSDGSTIVQSKGVLTDKDIRVIQDFIKDNYKEMYLKWSSMSSKGYFND